MNFDLQFGHAMLVFTFAAVDPLAVAGLPSPVLARKRCCWRLKLSKTHGATRASRKHMQTCCTAAHRANNKVRPRPKTFVNFCQARPHRMATWLKAKQQKQLITMPGPCPHREARELIHVGWADGHRRAWKHNVSARREVACIAGQPHQT